MARHIRKSTGSKKRLLHWPQEAIPPFHVAALSRYVGSAEHKNHPSFAGSPALRSDAFKCNPKYRDPEEIAAVLRRAILCGWIGEFEGDFPRYVWGWLDEILYEARLTNRSRGEYKAYGLEEFEYPDDRIQAGLFQVDRSGRK